jgi:hypothetical protein
VDEVVSEALRVVGVPDQDLAGVRRGLSVQWKLFLPTTSPQNAAFMPSDAALKELRVGASVGACAGA